MARNGPERTDDLEWTRTAPNGGIPSDPDVGLSVIQNHENYIRSSLKHAEQQYRINNKLYATTEYCGRAPA